MKKINFASDNYAGIHPAILQAIIHANQYPAAAYGNDEDTHKAVKKFHEHFGEACDVFFVFNGTAANVTAMATINRSYHAILCADTAHIQRDECGAPEKFIGSKLLLVPTENGKLSVELIKQHLQRVGDQHHVQPRIISISQSTEYGTVYLPEEIKALADFAHQHNMFLHMDGARISNAAASLNLELAAITQQVGVDVLSFGGTKNGMMLGEAVVFFNRLFSRDFLYIRKQAMQLASKMRFISVQFHSLLSNDLWMSNANHANKMAQLLSHALSEFAEVKISKAVEANAVFAIMPKHIISALQAHFDFYVWDETISEVRLMTSFNTTEVEITTFVATLKNLL